jgi:hypothetical protein
VVGLLFLLFHFRFRIAHQHRHSRSAPNVWDVVGRISEPLLAHDAFERATLLLLKRSAFSFETARNGIKRSLISQGLLVGRQFIEALFSEHTAEFPVVFRLHPLDLFARRSGG